MRLHAENPMAPSVRPAYEASSDFVGDDGNQIRFAFRREEIGLDVSRACKLQGDATAILLERQSGKERLHDFVLAPEIGHAAGRRSELGRTAHGGGYAQTVAAFRSDDVGGVLASKTDGEKPVAVFRRFGTGKTLAHAFREMVGIHVRMDRIGIRFAPADDDDAFPGKVITKDFVRRRIGIVDGHFADEIGESFLASQYGNEVRPQELVRETFVTDEYDWCRTKHVAKVHEHLAHVVARKFDQPLGRQVGIVRQRQRRDVLGRGAAFRSFRKQLRNPHRQDGRKSEHASVRIELGHPGRRVERDRTEVSYHWEEKNAVTATYGRTRRSWQPLRTTATTRLLRPPSYALLRRIRRRLSERPRRLFSNGTKCAPRLRGLP